MTPEFNEKTQSFSFNATWTRKQHGEDYYVEEKIGGTRVSVYGPMPEQFVADLMRELKQAFHAQALAHIKASKTFADLS